jgi:lipopolysaccharide biosynthesis glycosyltransferase
MQHDNPDVAQTTGASPIAGLGIPNGGLQVVSPAQAIYDKILGQLATSTTSSYDFADQSLLGDLFYGRWVALPYIYNALKTLRWEGVHNTIWRDENVKNVHYILSPKPWDESGPSKDPSHAWWTSLNEKRLSEEQETGVRDQF